MWKLVAAALAVLLGWYSIDTEADHQLDLCWNGIEAAERTHACNWVLNAPTVTDFGRASAYHGLGRNRAFQGNYLAAISDYDLAIELMPHRTSALIDRGIAHWRTGYNNLALRDFSEAIRFNSEIAEAYNYRSVVHRRLGNHNQALEDSAEAIRLNPNEPNYYNNRGNLFFDSGELDSAMDLYDTAILIDPEHAISYSNRARIFDRLGRFEAAIADYRQVVRYDPTYSRAYNNLAWILATETGFQDGPEALKLAQRAVHLHRDADTLDTLAAAFALVGQPANAVSNYEEAFRFDGARATDYQDWLKEAGYFDGNSDGIWDAEVRDAIEACVRDGCQLLVD